MATVCIQGGPPQHGKPQLWWGDTIRTTRKRQAGPDGVTDRGVVPERPGNAGGEKGPDFVCACEGDNGRESGASLKSPPEEDEAAPDQAWASLQVKLSG